MKKQSIRAFRIIRTWFVLSCPSQQEIVCAPYVFNAYYNNTTDTAYFNKGQGDITGTDPQFTDPAGGDFSIGTNLKAKGIPGVLWSGRTGYIYTGAVQRQETGGSCAATFVK